MYIKTLNIMELWKDICGYEGLYMISNLGNIKSIKKDALLKPIQNNNGYSRVSLYKNGKYKAFSVHRLVAEAFIPNPGALPQVNHKDEDKSNNKVDNLEWCTAKYNSNYGTIKERRKKSLIECGYWSGLSKKEYKKMWDSEHPDYYKEYREKHKDELDKKSKEYHKIYNIEKREKLREYLREWRKRRNE